MQTDIVIQGRAGEADFDSLIGPHLEAGYRTALAILHDPDEAYDAVQESAFRAWRKLHQLNPDGPARPWFLAIVVNRCRDVQRGRWWSVLRVPHVDRVASHDESESIDLERALAKLPHDDRLALFMHFYLDLPLDEVGVVLGLTAAGAKSRIYRAVKKLRPELEMT